MTGLASLRNASMSIGLVESIDINSVSLIPEFMVSDRVQIKVLLGPPLVKHVNVTSLPLAAMRRLGSIVTLALGETMEDRKRREGGGGEKKNDALKQKATYVDSQTECLCECIKFIMRCVDVWMHLCTHKGIIILTSKYSFIGCGNLCDH